MEDHTPMPKDQTAIPVLPGWVRDWRFAVLFLAVAFCVVWVMKVWFRGAPLSFQQILFLICLVDRGGIEPPTS